MNSIAKTIGAEISPQLPNLLRRFPCAESGKPVNQNGFSDHFPITMTVTEIDSTAGSRRQPPRLLSPILDGQLTPEGSIDRPATQVLPTVIMRHFIAVVAACPP